MKPLKAPYPWFGGKSAIASLVWERFGECGTYVEPFFGSGAVLLRRPLPFAGREVANDANGFVANFWRAVAADPGAVASHADHPVLENDLHARHHYLVSRDATLRERLEGDPAYYDARLAGWWVWGQCAWIGGGWCGGKGPWRRVIDAGGIAVLRRGEKSVRGGATRQRPQASHPRGVHRGIPSLGDEGRGVHQQGVDIYEWFAALRDRMARVTVCSGDWSRVCGEAVIRQMSGPTSVFLDPPYADTAGRSDGIYAVDSLTVAHEVREWAIEHGGRPELRIALTWI